jgi:hypothetical protein
MATADLRSGAATESPPSSQAQSSWLRIQWGLLLGVAALAVIALLPTPEGLPVAGQRMLALLAFAVIVWMTEALDYAPRLRATRSPARWQGAPTACPQPTALSHLVLLNHACRPTTHHCRQSAAVDLMPHHGVAAKSPLEPVLPRSPHAA